MKINIEKIGTFYADIVIRPRIDIKLWDIVKIKLLGKYNKKIVDTIIDMLCNNIRGGK